jgi:hypothetical protein
MEIDDQKILIMDCIKRMRKLNEWEVHFISSCHKKTMKKSLTDREIELLNEIWDKVT